MSNLLLVPYVYLPGHLEKKLTKMAYLAVFENIEKYVFVFLQNMNNTEKTFLLVFIVISKG